MYFRCRYARLISDGDSSSHRKLIESLPYGPELLVEKIECRNHILRNYAGKLRDITLNKKMGSVEQRSLVRQNIVRMRTGISQAIKYRKTQNLPRRIKCEELKKDILNGPLHIFGDHTCCEERGYFCKGPKPGEINEVPALKETGVFQAIQSALNRVVYHCNSLIEDVDNNCAEQFNGIVAKTIGGKRVNFSLRQSYQVNCRVTCNHYFRVLISIYPACVIFCQNCCFT